MMTEAQIEQVEQLLSYLEQHGEHMAYEPTCSHREWWMGDAANLLRDMLPDWSAFKDTPDARS